MDEKRGLVRWALALPAEYKTGKEEVSSVCECRNISNKGMCLSLEKEFGADSPLCVDVDLNGTGVINTNCRVVWQKKTGEEGNHRFLTGVSFTHVNDAYKEKIFDYVYRNRHEEVVQRWWAGVK